MIRQNTWLDPDTERCFTTYPVIKPLDTLLYNEWQAVTIGKSLKKRLEKNDQLEAYQNEIDDFIDRGVLVKVSRKEIADWQAMGHPVSFICHQPVFRPDKATRSGLCSTPPSRLARVALLPMNTGPRALISSSL